MYLKSRDLGDITDKNTTRMPNKPMKRVPCNDEVSLEVKCSIE